MIDVKHILWYLFFGKKVCKVVTGSILKLDQFIMLENYSESYEYIKQEINNLIEFLYLDLRYFKTGVMFYLWYDEIFWTNYLASVSCYKTTIWLTIDSDIHVFTAIHQYLGLRETQETYDQETPKTDKEEFSLEIFSFAF